MSARGTPRRWVQRLLTTLLAACALAGAEGTADGSTAPASDASPNTSIKRVSIVFACHLDVGFHSPAYPEPGWDNHVIGRYFNDHFPAAVRVAEALRQRNSTERLVWMTHSWLVSLFFDCPTHIGLNCPNGTTVAAFRAAIQRGDIVWHALPHNAQVELYDADLLQFGVRLTHGLDRSFGLPPKITASQRDIPGLTRAAVPILDYQGVKAISVGVNGGSAPPAVPHNRPFWWRDTPSGKQLLAFWHPGGYSGWPVDTRPECVQVDGLDHALCAAWNGDNAGPPTEDQVIDIFLRVRSSFPHAEIKAAGFDGFVSDLAAAAPNLDLPVVTGEIGDTWIHGAASDPFKLSEYRALLRMRRASTERYDDPDFWRFSRLLLKLPEHTWGVDVKEYPGDWEVWSNADLHKKLASLSGPDDPFQVAIDSWARQRSYSLWALQELGNSSEGLAGLAALSALEAGRAPPQPGAANSGFQLAILQGSSSKQPLRFESPSWQLEVCRETGAIVGLSFAGSSRGGSIGDSSGASGSSSSGSSGSTGDSSSSSSAASTWRSEVALAGSSLWGSLWAKLQLPAGLVRLALGAWWERPVEQQDAAGQRDAAGSSSWAAFDAPLALPVYSTYSEDDYNVIWDEYAYMGRPRNASDWFYRDFGKPGATTKGGARRADFLPRAQEVWWRVDDDGCLRVTVKAAFDAEAVQHAGAPRALWTEIVAPAGSQELSVEVTWEDKTPTRLPEAFWLRWVPRAEAVNASSWLMYKLGQPISPLEVVVNGSHALHAVGDEGVSVDSADGRTRLYIRSLDAAVVSPGAPRPLPMLRDQPDLSQGMAFCLSTNVWGTNFPSWIPYQKGDEHMRFRFLLQLEDRTGIQLPHTGAAAEAAAAAA